MISTNLLYDNTGSIAKCHNDRLGLKLVNLWIFNDFSVILIFSFKFMNMQIRYLALLTTVMSKL